MSYALMMYGSAVLPGLMLAWVVAKWIVGPGDGCHDLGECECDRCESERLVTLIETGQVHL